MFVAVIGVHIGNTVLYARFETINHLFRDLVESRFQLLARTYQRTYEIVA